MSNSQQVCNYLKKYKQLFAKEIYVLHKKSDIINSKKYSEPEHDLNQYESLISNCQECQLSTTRKNFVFGYGDPNADLILVGEAPGLDEDNEGIPFVGKAGEAFG